MTKITIVYMSFLISFIITKFLLIYFKKNSLAQNIRKEGPQSHLKKIGTPTMGGLSVIAGQVIPLMMTHHTFITRNYILLFLLYGLLGLMDDLYKLRKSGISARLKASLQVIFAAGIYMGFTETPYPFDILNSVYVPFFGLLSISTVLLFPFYLFVTTGTSNATNLTDGLDGLLSMISLGIFSLLGLLFFYKMQQPSLLGAYYYGELVNICLAMIGSLCGFLWFNAHKAEIFMGDCGSLAIGGGLAYLLIILKQPFALIGIAFIPFIETLSVIIQVAYFKRTGKRVFKMAPIHHHYEQLGYGETTISMRFFIVNLLIASFTAILLSSVL